MPTATLLSDRDLLQRLVGFDSTSSRSNVPIADFVCEYLARADARITRLPSADGKKINVVACIGPEPDAKRAGLVLSGHLDVVPAKESGWKSDPFAMTELDDAYYGRGTCDMKGSVALAMNVFAAAAPAQLRSPLMLMLTYDEELGSLGALRLAQTWGDQPPPPRSVLIGEPTSLRAVRMHKGHLKLHLAISGRAAHSGTPQLGVNAIEAAGRVLSNVADLRLKLEKETLETSRYFPEVPYVAINVARIAGGDAINVIPDRCTLDLGVRTLPGAESSSLVDRIRAAVSTAMCPNCTFKLELINDSPPMLLPEDAPIYRTLCSLIGQKESHSVSFSTDAGVLSRALDMQCVIYGPGCMDAAHRPNEFLRIDEFNRARTVLTDLVRRVCIEDPR